MLEKIRALLPANRIAAIVGLAAAAAAFLATIETSLVPGSPGAEAIAKAIVMLGSVAGAAKIVDRFLAGSQQWDKLLLHEPAASQPVIDTPTDDEVDDIEGPLDALPGDIALHPDYDPTQPPGLMPPKDA